MSTTPSTGRSDQRFRRASRLVKPKHFQNVFGSPQKTGATGYVVLYRANGLESARLGLAISKKCAPRSVDRNRLKRIARESFRLRRADLPGVDIVILCSRGAVSHPNHLLFQALDSAWLRIRKSLCDLS